MEALELYIHIPFCVKKCLYCDFNSHPGSPKEQAAYAGALVKEIDWWGRLIGRRQVASVFVGGGTPSWLDYSLMEQIFAAVHRNFSLARDAEVSLELNPGTVTAKALRAYQRMGINRVSIGLQSSNDDELALLGRIHSWNDFLRTFEHVRAAGFSNVNVDIMTGLPLQTEDKLKRTLQMVTMLRPEHISVYSLIVEPGTPFYERYAGDIARRERGEKTLELPDSDLEYALYDMARTFLTGKGYRQYEISNYAREGYACRHNLGYWERKSYLGFGVGAASLLCDSLIDRHSNRNPLMRKDPAQRSCAYPNLRFSNIPETDRYIDLWEKYDPGQQLDLDEVLADAPWIDSKTVQKLTRREAMEEFLFLGLRKTRGIREADFFNAFGLPIGSVYGSTLESQSKRGLLRRQGGMIALTKAGTDISNQVLAEFLR